MLLFQLNLYSHAFIPIYYVHQLFAKQVLDI